MYPTDIQCMIFHVCIIVTIILQCKHISALYPLEEDISQLTGINPPKRWVVCMEIRIRRCIKLHTGGYCFPVDLLSFFRCTSSGFKQQERCVRTAKRSGWLIKAVISSNRILLSNALFKQSKHCSPRQQTYRLLVHILLGFNLTVVDFKSLDSSRVLPLPVRCKRARAKLIISHNNGRMINCGIRNPWNIYGNTNMVTVQLILEGKMEPCYITFAMTIEAVDNNSQCVASCSSGNHEWYLHRM